MALTREQAIEEAKLQKKALATLGIWRRILFVLASCFAALVFFCTRSGAGWTAPGVIAAVLTGVSLLLAFIVNLSIRNGHRNVEKILASLE